MGIKYLNRFIRENAPSSVQMVSLAELSGKKIAVDVSIYLYRYATEEALIENMYLMLSVFKHYNIIPIFIFDGKPPAEKMELLTKRREDKKEAEMEYNAIKQRMDTNAVEECEKEELVCAMDMLKRRFVNVSKKEVQMVKDLIRAYGATYYDAPGEADELCAMLTMKGKVWACLSEDMDMFVYGCPRVLRYLSLLQHTVVLYTMEEILSNLGLSQKELREICVLSGTDYNNQTREDKCAPTLHTTLKYFKKFHRDKTKTTTEFYNWLVEKTNYIKNMDVLLKINDMFDLNKSHCNIEAFHKIRIANGPVIKSDIVEILKTDGFLFPMEK